jgi:zinc protease
VAAVVSADYNPLERFDGLFLIEGTPAHTHSMAEVEQAITEEIEQLKKEPVSRAELNQVKAQVIAHAIYRQDELESQAMMVGVPVMVGLPSDISEQWVQQIEAITPKQVQWVAQHYLVNNRLTVGYLEPTAIR